MEYRLSITKEFSFKVLDDLLPQIEKGIERYLLDLSYLEYCSAPNGVILLLLLQYLKSISKRTPILIPPHKTDVLSFLSNIRFFILAQNICDLTQSFPEPVNLNEMAKRNILVLQYIPAQLTEEGFRNWLTGSMTNMIFNRISHLSRERFTDLSTTYVELCKNIFEHSKSSGYIAAQPIKSLNKLLITVGDSGIGFFKSLSTYFMDNYEEKIRRHGPVWDEEKALDIAFAPEVSSKIQENNKKGYGLWFILNAISLSKGTIIARTGENKIRLAYQNDSWVSEKKKVPYFPGSQMEVYL